MRMRSAVRKLVLSIHLVVSVGWIGAAGAYVALDLTTVRSDDPDLLRSAYMGMDLVVRSVIVPLAIATLLTGVAISLGTRWGLFRHYWVVISLLLTVLATVVLLVETRTIAALAEVAADPSTTRDELSGLSSTLVHSVGGLVVLLAVLVLNVYKPRGLTRHGWRAQVQATSDPA